MRVNDPAVLCVGAVLAAMISTARAHAQAPSTPLTPVTVIGATSPTAPGGSLDRASSAVQSLSEADLAAAGLASLTGALNARLTDVTVGDNLDDPFQPDVIYRGFTASPVLGTPQGLAIYQGGVRVNEAFGDTVNWDLVPAFAVRRATVLGSNPAFGLNALGGSLALDMKTGFSDPGGQVELSGGSFGQRQAQGAYGVHWGGFGLYVGARVAREDGWRVASSDLARQVYADFSARTGRADIDLAITLADNRLDGASATPVQTLAIDRTLVFTGPQSTHDRLAFATLSVDYVATPALTLRGVAYARLFHQDLLNGNTTSYVGCASAALSGALCQPDANTPVLTSAGANVPDLSAGGALPIGELDREQTRSLGLGAAAQAIYAAPLAGRANALTLGGGVDAAGTRFASSASVGRIDTGLRVEGGGPLIATPESSNFTATPVALRARSTILSAYLADTLSVTDRLSLNLSARYNSDHIVLADQVGSALSGAATYGRLNPAIGLTYRATKTMTAYIGYAEGARAPTPSEIECSNPAKPCLLPSSLASDPPTLKQVVSRTIEAGVRGATVLSRHATVTWSAGLYRADLSDDIWGVATSLGSGYFENIGRTRRQGLQASVATRTRVADLSLDYSLVDATFRSPFVEASPSNPFANAQGQIAVRPGDRIPGVPRHRLKLGVARTFGGDWRLGADVSLVSSQSYHGDEANALRPLPGEVVTDLTLRHGLLSGRADLFATLSNLFDSHYATYGVLGDPTGVGAPGVPALVADPRFQSPAAPRAVIVGLEARF